MSFLFKFFLLFCSRDFRRFYAEKQQQGLIDPEVRARYVFQFLGWFLLFFVPVLIVATIFFREFFWNNEMTSNDIRNSVWMLCVAPIVSLFLVVPKIRLLERRAFAYSDGKLVEAKLIQEGSDKIKPTDLYTFTAAGKKQIASHLYNRFFTGRDRKVGDIDCFIYAQSAPRFACLYEPEKFKNRCLIKDALMPEQTPGWDQSERLQQAEKSMIYPQ
ncbi:hypothetical protein [Kiloniella laminariae]|uniref:hypothetical protein n=1 Tax=Kiloniella laminariae TaxID=454162 RepID=UPI0003776269|nr:hypothetical protein [Kiloniella laminariae]